MLRTKGISPKLAAALTPPITAVSTAMILTGDVDRTSLATVAALVIAAVLGYHASPGSFVEGETVTT